MKAPGNIYYIRKPRKESFHAGYRANEKTDGRNDLASVLQREAVWAEEDRWDCQKQTPAGDHGRRTKDIAECFGTLFFCALTGGLANKVSMSKSCGKRYLPAFRTPELPVPWWWTRYLRCLYLQSPFVRWVYIIRRSFSFSPSGCVRQNPQIFVPLLLFSTKLILQGRFLLSFVKLGYIIRI